MSAAKNGMTSPVKRVVMRCTPLRMLFYRDLKLGDRFYLIDDSKDPFNGPPFEVTINDIKGRYVQYRTSSGCLFSKEITTFLFCYAPSA